MAAYKENPETFLEALHNCFVTTCAIQYFISRKDYDATQLEINTLEKNIITLREKLTELTQ